MRIIVNANPHDVAEAVLSDALRELGFVSPAFAIALNGRFVPREHHAKTPLNDGDQLEVLAPMQGG